MNELMELDNDCDIVLIVNKTDLSDKILNDKTNSKVSLSIDDNPIIVLDKKEDFISKSSTKSVPWTIKYKPSRADQILDNQQASVKIKDWIHDFNSNVESNKIYYDDEEDEDRLESCILITGPTGCGKTSMVYAIAEELNYKVFEINCSSRRNSKFINQIKEVTLSHSVSRKCDSTSNLFTHNSNSNSPKVTKSTKKRQKPIDSKQMTLNSFFQKKISNEPFIDESSFSQETVNELKALSISSNSLILFDDVDIIFEEDNGFWQALSLLIENTKRPILLTATNQIENIKKEIKTALCVQMNYPTLSTLKKHLKEIVLKECYKEEDQSTIELDKNEINLINKSDLNDKNSSIKNEHIKQIELISRINHCDIRGCLNRLQFDFSSVNNLIINNDPPIAQLDTVNTDEPEFNLQTYTNLILSDLLSNDQFRINSRNDSTHSPDETYKSKNLRESILDEFVRLKRDEFKSSSLGEFKEEILNWSIGFKQCILEVESHLALNNCKQSLYCDYLPYLFSIMNHEEERLKLFIKYTRRARRFLHHLDGLNFHLSDFVKEFLRDFYFSSCNNI